MEEFLKQLGIDKKGSFIKDTYVIDLTETEWGKYLSKLERSDEIEENEDSSIVSYESSSQQFENDKYIITLIGDLEEDKYKLTVREK